MDIKQLTEEMNSLVRSKGWYEADSRRPQTPRNLAISLAVETAEILDLKPRLVADDALWEDVSYTTTKVASLDPILFTDEATGRTFNSQLSGANSLFEYTDDDGENWTPAQQGPPNGGADHQTVASGPYPASATPPNALWPASGDKRAVYYCSQDVALAFCSRSDDGGVTCRRWNWRQGTRTQLTADTTAALFILDALGPMADEPSTGDVVGPVLYLLPLTLVTVMAQQHLGEAIGSDRQAFLIVAAATLVVALLLRMLSRRRASRD